MSAELELHFPHYGGGRRSLNLVKRFNAARANQLTNPGEESELIYNAVCREVAQTNRPMKFSPPGQGANPTGGNVLAEHLDEFEGICAFIEENYSTTARTMPLYEFLKRVDKLKEKLERNKPNPEMPPK